MADTVKKKGELEFAVSKANKAIADLEKLAKANAKVGDSAKKNKGAADEEAQGVGGLGVAWGTVTKVLGGVAAAYGVVKVAQSAMNQAEEAAKIRDLSRAYESLSKSAGKDAEGALQSVINASGGVMDRASAMQKMNKAMMMGVNADMGEMVKVAKAASLSTGESFEYMFDSIVTGLARQSVPILDNLGIIVKAEDANEEYAASLGKTASELTAAERRQAFMNSAVKAGGELVEKMGGDAALMAEADSFGKMRASATDLGNALKDKLVDPLSIAAGHMTTLLETFTSLAESVDNVPMEMGADGVLRMSGAESKKAPAHIEDMYRGGTWTPSSEREVFGPEELAEQERVRTERIAAIGVESEALKKQAEIKVLLADAERDLLEISDEALNETHDAMITSLDERAAANEDYYQGIMNMARWHEEQDIMSKREYYEMLLADESTTAEQRMEIHRAMGQVAEEEAEKVKASYDLQAAASRVLGNTLLAVTRTRIKTIPAVVNAINQEAQAHLAGVAAVAAIDAAKYTYMGIAAMAQGLTAVQAGGFFAAAGKAAGVAAMAGVGVGVLHHNANALSGGGGGGMDVPDDVSASESGGGSGGGGRSYSINRTAPMTINIVHNYYGSVAFGSQAESDGMAVQAAIDGGDVLLPGEEVA